MFLKIGKISFRLNWKQEMKMELSRFLELSMRIKNAIRVFDMVIRHISRVTALLAILLLLIIICSTEIIRHQVQLYQDAVNQNNILQAKYKCSLEDARAITEKMKEQDMALLSEQDKFKKLKTQEYRDRQLLAIGQYYIDEAYRSSPNKKYLQYEWWNKCIDIAQEYEYLWVGKTDINKTWFMVGIFVVGSGWNPNQVYNAKNVDNSIDYGLGDMNSKNVGLLKFLPVKLKNRDYKTDPETSVAWREIWFANQIKIGGIWERFSYYDKKSDDKGWDVYYRLKQIRP
jgi:hypothetical protein